MNIKQNLKQSLKNLQFKIQAHKFIIGLLGLVTIIQTIVFTHFLQIQEVANKHMYINLKSSIALYHKSIERKS